MSKFVGRKEEVKQLSLAGFIVRDFTWHIKSGLDSKLSKYRFCDNYLSNINRNSFRFKSSSALLEWNTMVDLQFKNLVLNNRALVYQILKIDPNKIISENPFFQRKTLRNKGCQIDYLIQTKFNTLYICEIKFSKNIIDSSVINEVQKKIEAINYPKGYSCRPVLIHVNGVTEDVIDSDYFTAIIDFSTYLE